MSYSNINILANDFQGFWLAVDKDKQLNWRINYPYDKSYKEMKLVLSDWQIDIGNDSLSYDTYNCTSREVTYGSFHRNWYYTGECEDLKLFTLCEKRTSFSCPDEYYCLPYNIKSELMSLPSLAEFSLYFNTSRYEYSTSSCTPRVTINFMNFNGKNIDPLIFANYEITNKLPPHSTNKINRLNFEIESVMLEAVCDDAWYGKVEIDISGQRLKCKYNGYDEYWADGGRLDSTGKAHYQFSNGKAYGEAMPLECKSKSVENSNDKLNSRCPERELNCNPQNYDFSWIDYAGDSSGIFAWKTDKVEYALFTDIKRNWYQGKALCQSLSGNLASVTNKQEQGFILSNQFFDNYPAWSRNTGSDLLNSRGMWLGARQRENGENQGKFEWDSRLRYNFGDESEFYTQPLKFNANVSEWYNEASITTVKACYDNSNPYDNNPYDIVNLQAEGWRLYNGPMNGNTGQLLYKYFPDPYINYTEAKEFCKSQG